MEKGNRQTNKQTHKQKNKCVLTPRALKKPLCQTVPLPFFNLMSQKERI